MTTAVSLRSLTLLFSAGWGGTYFYNHADATRDIILTQLTRALARSEGKSGGSTTNTNTNGIASTTGEKKAILALSEKVNDLAANISRSMDRPVVVVGGNGSSVSAIANGLSLAGWAIMAIGAGSAAYYIAIWKGWRMKDLAWVSQTTFDTTINTMQKGLEKVSGVVSCVRKEFSERLKLVEVRVEAVRKALSTQMETEIGQVKNGIEEVSAEVSCVHQVLADVTGRIDAIDGKLDTATNGIMALVRVVSSLAPDNGHPGNPFWELKRIADMGNDSLPMLQSNPIMTRRVSYGIGGILNKNISKVNGIKEAANGHPPTAKSPR